MKQLFKTKKQIINFILGIFLLIFTIIVWVRIIILFLEEIKKMFNTYPTISVALITGLLAFVSVPVGKFFENKYTIKNQVREERQKVYVNFLEWLINNVLYSKINNNKNVIKELQEQQKLMTIYASDNVLKAWSTFKDITMNSDINKKNLTEDEKTRFYIKHEAPFIETLIMAIRKEMGYKNKNIKKYDILKLYINDINKYLK